MSHPIDNRVDKPLLLLFVPNRQPLIWWIEVDQITMIEQFQDVIRSQRIHSELVASVTSTGFTGNVVEFREQRERGDS